MVSLNFSTLEVNNNSDMDVVYKLYTSATKAKDNGDYGLALSLIDEAKSRCEVLQTNFDAHKYTRYLLEAGWRGDPRQHYLAEIDRFLSYVQFFKAQIDSDSAKNPNFEKFDKQRLLKSTYEICRQQFYGMEITLYREKDYAGSLEASINNFIFAVGSNFLDLEFYTQQNELGGQHNLLNYESSVRANADHAFKRVLKNLKKLNYRGEVSHIHRELLEHSKLTIPFDCIEIAVKNKISDSKDISSRISASSSIRVSAKV